MSSAKKKRLSLAEKIHLIEDHEKNKSPVKYLIEKYGVGKTQVYEALKNKDQLKKEWLQGKSGKVKKLTKGASSDYEEINRAVYEWFLGTREKNVPVSGPMLQAEALEVAKKLGKTDFKASNGWLDRFRARHNIGFKTVSGEANDVDDVTVEEWKERLRHLVEGYDEKDIFNGDELGLFYRQLPNKSLTLKGETCSGGKMSKERLTVYLCANMKGEFEVPMVIGKAARPRCFKRLDIASLPVLWRFNKKAWNTQVIMENWLKMFNEKMKRQGRHVLLFLDNATCHPNITLSNVKIIFFPPNTTSRLQPIDQGVGANLKTSYRTRVMRALLLKIRDASSVTELSNSLNVLEAIQWIRQAQDSIRPETVRKCFLKAGFPDTKEQVNNDDDGDAQDLDDAMAEIENLCRQGNLEISSEELVHFDDGLSAFGHFEKAVDCLELQEGNQSEEDSGSEAEDGNVPKIQTYQEAAKVVGDLEEFAAFKNSPRLLQLLGEMKDDLAICLQRSARQSSIHDFFSKEKQQPHSS